VARSQRAPEPAALGWRRVDAGGDLAATVARLAEALAQAGAPLGRG
jgi:hypothetical protein